MEVEQMSLIEVAEMLMEKKRTPQNIQKLIKEVLEIKNIQDEDYEAISQLYVDITTSCNFVYCGDDNWDLKSRQKIEEYDKDGASFNVGLEEDDDDDDNGVSVDDYNLKDDDSDMEDDDDEVDDNDQDDSPYVPETDDIISEDEEEAPTDEDGNLLVNAEDLDDDDDFEEDKYNKYMDDYEDMYDK